MMQNMETERKRDDQSAFDQLDHHVRSASTLGHILGDSRDSAAKDTSEKKRLDLGVVLLNYFARSLVRGTEETAAVGLLGDSTIIVANNYSLTRPSGTNESIEAPAATRISDQSPWIRPVSEWPTITEFIYRYRSYESRDIRPDFASHANTVFLLLQTYLRQTERNDQDAAGGNLVRYVTGMSLARLDDVVGFDPKGGKTIAKEALNFLKRDATADDFREGMYFRVPNLRFFMLYFAS